MNNLYLWVDLETTGLNPEKDDILEVAYVLAAGDALNFCFEPMCSVTIGNEIWIERVDAYVSKMHLMNGLFKYTQTNNGPMYVVEGMKLEIFETQLVAELVKHQASNITLAGQSVHFDYQFIKSRMPVLASLLSHRLLDVRSVQNFLEDTIGDLNLDKGKPKHRAASDLEYTIRTYETLQKYVSEEKEE